MTMGCRSCGSCKHARKLVNPKRREDQAACNLATKYESHEEFLVDLNGSVVHSMFYKNCKPDDSKSRGVMRQGVVVDKDSACKEYEENL